MPCEGVPVVAMTNTDVSNATPPRVEPNEAIVRAAESALQVCRRYQFFVWSQSYLNRLIPHQLAVCGSYDRGTRELAFNVFNTTSVDAGLLDALGDARSPLMRRLQQAWLEARCKPTELDTAEALNDIDLQDARQALLAADLGVLMFHGISRPDRPQEIESFFIFAAPGPSEFARCGPLLELLIPHAHGAWRRVQSVERGSTASGMPAPPALKPGGVTQREREILSWLREGKSNQQIADELGISALTVKNHVQKILRKLNSANRAQAVAQAISMQLLDRSAVAAPRFAPEPPPGGLPPTFRVQD